MNEINEWKNDCMNEWKQLELNLDLHKRQTAQTSSVSEIHRSRSSSPKVNENLKINKELHPGPMDPKQRL